MPGVASVWFASRTLHHSPENAETQVPEEKRVGAPVLSHGDDLQPATLERADQTRRAPASQMMRWAIQRFAKHLPHAPVRDADGKVPSGGEQPLSSQTRVTLNVGELP